MDKKDVNEVMQKILSKHNFDINKPKDIARYTAGKLHKYKMSKYPSYIYIFLDDAAGNVLINKRNSELIKLIK